ncbi:PepSY-associated TM helix domain-containing protein [Mucilaginibacter terrenus]|nr:PepSY-associated TM helix domain-containing protein [Mucilaginibacter terrenus]
MKVFFRNIHLYLSLAAGIVIFCSCLTGTILVFEREINHTLHPQRYFVEASGHRMPLSQLTKAALKQVPKAKLASVMVFNDPLRTVEIGVIMPEKGKPEKGINKKSTEEKSHKAGDNKGKDVKKGGENKKPNTTLYVNPYTGKVIEQFGKKGSFLFSVEMFHRFLLAGKDSAGDMIVGISSLLFLFILITGVVLWWPKTKAVFIKRIKVKWDGNTKRLVHDLHLVTGFYTSVFLIVIVLTGLVMSFTWANKALFALTGSKLKEKDAKQPASTYSAGLKKLSADEALEGLNLQIKNAEYFTIRTPKDSVGTYSISVLPKGAFENTSDTYFIDQYNGRIVSTEKFVDKSTGQRVRSFIKPVHTGSVYGLPTKIISFIVCLLSLIFPVTGVIMWLNRIKKKDRKKSVIRRPKAAKEALAV